KCSEAEDWNTKALQRCEAWPKPQHSVLHIVLSSLGVLLAEQNEHEKAVAVYEKLLRSDESTLGPNYKGALETLRELAA
ncbi:hypothetical protein K470DRAFT_206490, partial [Piedraia hortae CBS 480.64]